MAGTASFGQNSPNRPESDWMSWVSGFNPPYAELRVDGLGLNREGRTAYC